MIALQPRGRARTSGRARLARNPPARPVTYPQPLHHTTTAMPVEGMPSEWTARVLVLRKSNGAVEIYAPLLAYMKAHPHKSDTWQNDIARALGLLWDFAQTRAPAEGSSPLQMERSFLKGLFRAFALALMKGTAPDGRDPTGLHWPPGTRPVAVKMIKRIEDFAAWCHVDGPAGELGPDPLRLPDDGPTFTDVLVWARLRNVKMMKHLEAEPKAVRRRGIVDLGRATRGNDLEPVKAFPTKDIGRLIWEGHRRPAAANGEASYGVHNIRDQMMAILDGWGGLRRSEGLHLWVGDVTEHPEHPGHALVVLHHPTEALVEYPDPIARELTIGTRAEALRTVYGLSARSEVTRGRYHAGWKGMSLDKDNRAIVHWLDDRAASLFWVLYLTYLRYVRSDVMARRKATGGRDHPFLFVSERRNRNGPTWTPVGDPYSAQAYERNHKAAVLRIGLPYGKKHGTTTHGLRHMYGAALANLAVGTEIVRKAMHHVSPLSQLVYMVPDPETTDARLREAWNRIEAGASFPMAGSDKGGALDSDALGRDTVQALQRLRAAITGGGGVE